MASFTDVPQLLTTAALAHPDQTAVIDVSGDQLTWAELDDQVSRVATGLGRLGLVGGHRAMLVLGNRVEFITCYLGMLRAQVVAVPVNPGSTVDETERMIADSGARLVVCEEATAEVVRSAVGRREQPPIIVMVGAELANETAYADLLASESRPAPPLSDPEKLAALLYTSGTSNRPRGAMLTHRALVANLDQLAAVEPPMMNPTDIVLGVLPLFHVYGLNAVLGGVLKHGATLVLMSRFDAEVTLDLIADQQVTMVPVAPAAFGPWLECERLTERFSSVRLIVSGSAPLAAEMVRKFSDASGVPVHQGYGLTEAAPVVTSTLCSVVPQAGSVGAALPGISLMLRDENGRPVEGDDPGEIYVRGNNLFSGYWPDGNEAPDAEGWWATGDVGFLDAAGDLFLVDRVKELVIVSGFNVYPTEVEEVIGEVPGVAEVAVIGVPDPVTGEAVVAYVLAAEPDSADLVGAIEDHLTTRIARFKRPSRIEVVEELPFTPTGKVQKGRLRTIERRRGLELLD